MEDMLVTSSVLKLPRSRDSRDEQSKNMELILVTFAVLKLRRSRDSRDEQDWNIEDILVTTEVLRYWMPLISVRLVHL